MPGIGLQTVGFVASSTSGPHRAFQFPVPVPSSCCSFSSQFRFPVPNSQFQVQVPSCQVQVHYQRAVLVPNSEFLVPVPSSLVQLPDSVPSSYCSSSSQFQSLVPTSHLGMDLPALGMDLLPFQVGGWQSGSIPRAGRSTPKWEVGTKD